MQADDVHVTIQGNRFTLEAIESVLQGHDEIREAAVAVQRVGEEDQLVAYIVPEGVGPAVDELRTHLHDRLPPYMVPFAFVPLVRLPRTSTGDVDRQALPSHNPEWSVAERGYAAPRNPVEAAIAEIWAEVLMIDRVGIHDDFLELGGDSLIGGRVVSRIFERLGREIRIESLFERGTVAEVVDDFFADLRDSPV